jgi:hypothetical protein
MVCSVAVSDVSRAQLLIVSCACGASREVTQWDVVDAGARPDLFARAAAGDLFHWPCEACRAPIIRNAPLAVALRENRYPLVLIFAPDKTASEDIAWFDPLYRDLGDHLPPPMALPFDAYTLVLNRDLDADCDDVSRAAEEVAGQEGEGVAARYKQFLEQVHRSMAGANIFTMLGEISQVDSAERFVSLLRERPDLIGDHAVASLDALVAENPADETLSCFSDLLRSAQTDARASWHAFRPRLEALWEVDEQHIKSELSTAREAGEVGRYDEVIQRVEPLLGRGVQLQIDPLIAEAAGLLGTAHQARGAPG